MFSTLEDQVDRHQTLEENIFYQDCPQHLQGEDESSFPLQEISYDCVVQVEKEKKEKSLVEGHHIVLAGSRSD